MASNDSMQTELPQVYARDVARTRQFYIEVLGFAPGDSDVVELGENKFQIVNAETVGEGTGCQTIFIQTDDIFTIWENVTRTARDKVFKTLKIYDWGKEFSVWDPEGNKVSVLDRTPPVNAKSNRAAKPRAQTSK
jgi:predicted enzyme related to lactoylglutathione lyase